MCVVSRIIIVTFWLCCIYKSYHSLRYWSTILIDALPLLELKNQVSITMITSL